jgi:hypothetical protein
MIKIATEKIDQVPFSILSLYDSINRIPFSLNLNQNSTLPETIYVRNLYGGNLIEFRFNKFTRELYDITQVMIQNNSVIDVADAVESVKVDHSSFFKCYIDGENSLEISEPMYIIRDKKSFTIVWSAENLKYFRISTNCVIGMNADNCLTSVTISQINKDDIMTVFGF